jgi:DNA-nicking Smr family endonuclease
MPSAEDLALFRRVLADVTPLAGKAPPEDAEPEFPAAPVEAPGKPPRHPAATGKKLPPVPDAASFPAFLDEHVPGRAPGLDRRTSLRLQRGQLEIDGRIDLHGMRLAEAQLAVTAFLGASHAMGRRCVLVITGKGGRPGGGRPPENLWDEPSNGVIRTALPRWLAEAPLKPLVLACTPAQPQHGGGGAFYVMLRRRRASG